VGRGDTIAIFMIALLDQPEAGKRADTGSPVRRVLRQKFCLMPCPNSGQFALPEVRFLLILSFYSPLKFSRAVLLN